MADFSAFRDVGPYWDEQGDEGSGGPPPDPYGPGTGGYGPVAPPVITSLNGGAPVPPLTGGGGGGGNGGGGGGGYGFTGFPRFDPKHPEFIPLTLDQARAEPGYAFAEQQGQQGIERSAAAKGALRTGGTLKDIGTWIHDFATRSYGDANQRELNRFLANYQVEKDQFAPILAEAQANFSANLQRSLSGGHGGGGGGTLSYEEWKRQNGYA